MFDIISPQEIDKKMSLIEEKIFDKDPVCAFCMSTLLMCIRGEWDSGQMPTERHDKLILIDEEISDAISSSLVDLPSKLVTSPKVLVK